ncbi:hypothetical protein [Bifidobacterium pullorum]|uniref:hypothetical protein n=1 Tax=Bifidobacterium pullorum TaxID=78448 RepID=UPI003208D59E
MTTPPAQGVQHFVTTPDTTILYYDDGQKQLARILSDTDELIINIDHRHLDPTDYRLYRLAQVADLACCLELTNYTSTPDSPQTPNDTYSVTPETSVNPFTKRSKEISYDPDSNITPTDTPRQRRAVGAAWETGRHEHYSYHAHLRG